MNLIMINNLICVALVLSLNAIYADIISPLQTHESCSVKNKAINDCNWCVCKGSTYYCKMRDCARVDKFGHFNDGLQGLDVGMEGHGSWRTSDNVCEPNIHYRRKGILCVCTKDGEWPNPVCRDVFRVLRTVTTANKKSITKEDLCSPNKLYLISCNVCICPYTGHFNPQYCTNRTCSLSDPVINDVDLKTEHQYMDDDNKEVYAECTEDIKYKIGCQVCSCLRNNRLLCDICDSKNELRRDDKCNGKAPRKPFVDDDNCNSCICDEQGRSFCTLKQCFVTNGTTDLRNLDNELTNYESVNRPSDLEDCVPGTRFKLDCNTCFCDLNEKGEKYFSCTLNVCYSTEDIDMIQSDCVIGTNYRKDCRICKCYAVGDSKWEVCRYDPACADMNSSRDLQKLQGYCEPGHVYKKGCSKCRCMSNGKVIQCTNSNCAKEVSTKMKGDGVIEILKTKSNYQDKCPAGQAYKVGCNFCFCLTNGNALCTNNKCNHR